MLRIVKQERWRQYRPRFVKQVKNHRQYRQYDRHHHQHLDQRKRVLTPHWVGPPLAVDPQSWLATPLATGAPTKPVTVRMT